jgi:Protein of unknown function (DUF2786)
MGSRDEILDKIRKLHAHAESAEEIGNEAEAQAFAAKVQELLTAYKLSMADIGTGKSVAEEPVGIEYITWQDLELDIRSKRVAWTEQLAQLISEAYYCKFVISRGVGRIGFFVGTDTDREIAKFMFITIGRALNKIAEAANRAYKIKLWKEAGSPRPYVEPDEARGYKAGFMVGFLQRLHERFREELNPKVSVAQTQAIVLVRKDAIKRVNEWCDENLNLKSMPGIGIRSGNSKGRAHGRDRANELSLKSNPISRTGKSTKELK